MNHGMFDSIRRRGSVSQVHLLNRLFLAGTLLAFAIPGSFIFAQSPTAEPAAPAPNATPHRNHRKVHPGPSQTAAPRAAPAIPPAPEWPINDRAVRATVTWTRDKLSIDATNSSLEQILTDVAAETGSTVEGVSRDERIFGSFGPAPAREVLSQLLQGSGYNVVMVGDQGQGVPRQIILSAQNSNKPPQGATRTNQEENEDDTPDYPQPDPYPQPVAQPPMQARPGFPPEGSRPMRPQQQNQQQPQTDSQPGQPPNTPPNE